MDETERRSLAQALMRGPSLQQRAQDVYGLDPNIVRRGSILPYGVNKEGGTEWAIPQMGVDMMSSFLLPGHVVQGGSYTPEDATAFAANYLVPATTMDTFPRAPRPGEFQGMPQQQPQAKATGGELAKALAKQGDDLLMDDASRMARAKAQGFDVDAPLYHGTKGDITEFKVRPPHRVAASDKEFATYLTGDPKLAEHFAEIASVRDALPGEVPHEVLNYMGEKLANIYDEATIYPVVIKPGRQMAVDMPYYDSDKFSKILAKAKKNGFDTVRLKGMNEGYAGIPPSDQIAVLKPENIRSRFAKFDPKKANSADILAGVGAGAVSAPLLADRLMQMQEEQK